MTGPVWGFARTSDPLDTNLETRLELLQLLCTVTVKSLWMSQKGGNKAKWRGKRREEDSESSCVVLYLKPILRLVFSFMGANKTSFCFCQFGFFCYLWPQEPVVTNAWHVRAWISALHRTAGRADLRPHSPLHVQPHAILLTQFFQTPNLIRVPYGCSS